MGFTLIFAGLCFLLTPCFNVVDLLPDFIGCLLIRRGLARVGFLSDHLREAKVAVRRLLAVSCGKVAGLLVVNLFRDETTTLLITFLFTVLELLFTTPLLRELLEGAEDLGIRFECRIAMDHAETVRTALTVFLWARCLGALLPEMLCLWNPLYTGEFTPDYLLVSESLKRWKLFLTLLQLVGVGIFAVWTSLQARRLFRGMDKDETLCSQLQALYEERYGKDEVFLRQLSLDKTLVWLLAAAVFGLRLYMNRLNYLPDFLLFWALSVAYGHLTGERKNKKLIACGVLATLCFALRSYGAAVFYPYFGPRWQGLWAVYPAGIVSAVTLALGLFWLVQWLDQVSEELYGRRRVKTVGLKIAAVLTAIGAFADYAFASLYDFMRWVNPAFPLASKATTELINIAFTWGGFCIYAFFVLRVWVIVSAMRQDLKLEMKE